MPLTRGGKTFIAAQVKVRKEKPIIIIIIQCFSVSIALVITQAHHVYDEYTVASEQNLFAILRPLAPAVSYQNKSLSLPRPPQRGRHKIFNELVYAWATFVVQHYALTTCGEAFGL